MSEPANPSLATISANPLSGESWERILKFIAINFVVGIVVAIILNLISVVFMGAGRLITLFLMLGVIIAAQAFILSWYEQWRGCKL